MTARVGRYKIVNRFEIDKEGPPNLLIGAILGIMFVGICGALYFAGIAVGRQQVKDCINGGDLSAFKTCVQDEET